MAEDFKALVAAQKETSKLIQQQIRQSMSDEERDASDKALEAISLERSESARRGWETRQQNIALDAAKNDKKGGAAQEEDESKAGIKSDKQLTMLGKIGKSLGDGFKNTKEKAGKGLMGMLKAGLFGGLILAGVAFLNSPFFGKMIKVIKKDIIPFIGMLYRDFIKPFALFVGRQLMKFFGDLATFAKDPSWENFKKFDITSIAVGIAAALAVITKLFGPKLLFKSLKLGAKLFGKTLGLAGKLLGKIGIPGMGKGGASKLGGAVPKGGVSKLGGAVPKGGGKIAGAAKGLATMGKAAGKSIGAFIGGILKGIGAGLTALGNPVAIAGLLAATAAIIGISAAIRIMTPAFEPIGKMMKSFGESVREVFGGLGDFVEDIGKTIEGIITKMGASIGAVIDKISGLQTAGTDATTKQIKELSAIPADGMFSAAKGIDAMKAALDGFGGGTLSKIGDSLFGSGGPIEKIIALTKKVPELMKAAEAITVLGAAGGDFAKTEAELKRRKEVVELKKDIADGPSFSITGNSKENFAKKQAELAALEGQAMKMNAVGSGGTSGVGLKRIEKLVTEIVMMKREQQKNASAGTTFNKGGDQTTVNQGKTIVTQPTPIANIHKSSAMAAAGA